MFQRFSPGRFRDAGVEDDEANFLGRRIDGQAGDDAGLHPIAFGIGVARDHNVFHDAALDDHAGLAPNREILPQPGDKGMLAREPIGHIETASPQRFAGNA